MAVFVDAVPYSLTGSVIGFWTFLTLVANIGPDRAAYTSLLFPVVALLISTVAEGYQWTLIGAAGLLLVMLGNWLVMRRTAG